MIDDALDREMKKANENALGAFLKRQLSNKNIKTPMSKGSNKTSHTMEAVFD